MGLQSLSRMYKFPDNCACGMYHKFQDTIAFDLPTVAVKLSRHDIFGLIPTVPDILAE